MDIVNLALQIATKAHANQLDKGGAQYIEHPKFVASLLTSQRKKPPPSCTTSWRRSTLQTTSPLTY